MTSIETTTSRILVKGTPFLHKDILKAIAGAQWDSERRCWTFPLSSSILPALLSLYPSSTLDAGAKTLLAGVERASSAIASKSSSWDSLPSIEHTALKPWLHQLRSFHFARHSLALDSTPAGGGALLGLDMGCGKTKVVIDLINNSPQLQLILVTCPIPVVQTWVDEAAKHKAGREIRVLGLGMKESSDGSLRPWPLKSRASSAKEFLGAWPTSDKSATMIVINHESVWREPFKAFAKAQLWDLLVVDECHRAKAPGGKLSMFLANSLGCFPARLGLSGTPMPKDPMDIYAQARFLDPGLFGTSWTRFKARYGIWGGFENRKLIGLQNQEEFNRKLDQLMIRVKSDDVMDLPEQQHIERWCVLTAEEAAAYGSMKEQLMALVGSGVVTAANALTRLLRLQQIVQGTVADDDGRVHRIGTTKQDLLRDVLEDLPPDQPVVVFCRFKDDLLRIHETCAALGRGSCELSGGLNELSGWKAGKLGPVIAVQIQSGGVGVDFSRANYTIYYSPTFDMGAYEQSLKRTHRPGQSRTCFYIHLLAKGTIDRDIMSALRQKKKVVETVLGGLT